MLEILTKSRPWFDREVLRYPLHPAVKYVLNVSPHYKYIKDWREMMLEWPHESQEDPTKIAYTADNDKGERDIQTRTSIGKYLKRHMPDLQDHVLRDIVSRFVVDARTCHITDDMEKMLWVLDNGPDSCMKKDWHPDLHPYRVYEPELGWAMAYRLDGDTVMGRALVRPQDKEYVRSYKGNGGCDNLLESWLTTQGYTQASSWNGCRVARIEHPRHGYVMPYIDGDAQSVNDNGRYFEITDCGDYDATNTDGTLGAMGETCDSCGGHFHEDEMTWIGEDGDQRVCDSCLSHHYTLVIGYRGNEYYLHDSDDYVYCESDGNYYDSAYLDYNDIMYVHDDGAYYLADDVWFCEGCGENFTNDTPCYEVDGCNYHADHLPDGWEVNDEGVLVEVTDEVTEEEPVPETTT
jgi:hypothetical protein